MSSAPTDLYQNSPSQSNAFIRAWSLTLLGPSGQTWSVSDSNASGAQSGGSAGPILDPLRVTFQTRQRRVNTAGNYANIAVYNIALLQQSTSLFAVAKLYNSVVLRAGYVGNPPSNSAPPVIFRGTIQNIEVGRTESLTETYLKIFATENDFGYNGGQVNISYGANSRFLDIVNALAQPLAANGAVLHIQGVEDQPSFIRGYSFIGTPQKGLEELGLQAISRGGDIYITPINYIANVGTTVTLNASTGLIGMAKLTGPNGLECDCLLNPSLGVYSNIQIDNASVNQANGINPLAGGVGASQVGPEYTAIGYFVNTSTDGVYQVLVIEHAGDTRGNEWQTHITAWPNGQPTNPSANNFYSQYGVQPTNQQTSTFQSVTDGNAQLPTDPSSSYYEGGVTPL